MIFFAEFYS